MFPAPTGICLRNSPEFGRIAWLQAQSGLEHDVPSRLRERLECCQPILWSELLPRPADKGASAQIIEFNIHQRAPNISAVRTGIVHNGSTENAWQACCPFHPGKAEFAGPVPNPREGSRGGECHENRSVLALKRQDILLPSTRRPEDDDKPSDPAVAHEEIASATDHRNR